MAVVRELKDEDEVITQLPLRRNVSMVYSFYLVLASLTITLLYRSLSFIIKIRINLVNTYSTSFSNLK
jgi:hypothetical protein